PHAHLDKARSWSATGAGYGDLLDAVNWWREYAAGMDGGDVYSRARRTVGDYLASGFTAVRTHVDLLLAGGDPLRGVDALLTLRDEVAGVLDMQVCVLVSPLSGTDVVEEAVARGIDVLGGCPHLADDPAAETTRLLDIAERHGLPVDLHTDEQLDPDVLSIIELAEQVRARAMGQLVTASHCVSLGMLDAAPLARVIDHVLAADLGIVTLPITNLYLQGRAHPTATPRGLTAIRALLDAGVRVAAGGDNIRDPFNPMGRADPFETTSLLITAGHLDSEAALALVTDGGRSVLGLPAAGPRVGARADLVAVEADDITDALAGPTGSRLVLRAGRVVSETTVSRVSALDAALVAAGRQP
ncbi:MAG: cytosine/creatinine deaminase, partial [Frankiaceae bacterium]|nr:cytosine/creatinine deaminase [Frankiaceae bacterium]